MEVSVRIVCIREIYIYMHVHMHALCVVSVCPHLLARRGGYFNRARGAGALSRALRASGAPLVVALPRRGSSPCVQRKSSDHERCAA